ncbi:hypothetical protein AC244_32095 [Ensifer adhaerens]|uniref:AAA domain-containing protein n=1 Tax=Ensifer adhaerens TaxID=106592 RepID=A0A0L8BEU3_ENSAD|nr:hypothetical protein [Ensifer adhaerens]KOF13186.1 hypothetical protein AC244_32095 [Ensifer adhaerens]
MSDDNEFKYLVEKPSATETLAESNNAAYCRAKMAGWNKDEWADPSDCTRFPLREISPGAVDYLVQVNRMSVRDIKHLCNFLELDIDARDTAGFYDAYLGILEDHPWLAPHLEVLVANARLGIKSGKVSGSHPDKLARIISKLPLAQLCLDSNEDIADRIREIVIPGAVAPDLAVASFCEYAIHHYRRLYEEQDGDGFGDLVSKTLDDYRDNTTKTACEEAPNALDEAAKLEVLPDEHGTLGHNILQALSEIDRPTTKQRYDLVKTITQLASELDELSNQSAFEILARLCHLAARFANLPPAPEASDALHRLAVLGIKPPSDDKLSAEVVLKIASQATLDKLVEVENILADLPDAEANAEAAASALTTASAERRFADVPALAAKAEEMHEHQQRLSARRNLLIGELTQLLDQTASFAADVTTGDVIGRDEATDAVLTVDQQTLSSSGAPSEAQSNEITAHEFGGSPTPLPEASPARDEDVIEPGNLLASVADADETHMDPPAVISGSNEVPTGPNLIESSHQENLALDLCTLDETSIDQDHDPESEAIDSSILAILIDRDLIGVAADAAESIEAAHAPWPLDSSVLRAAAAARGPLRDYGHDTDRLTAIAEQARSAETSDLNAVLLLGALLRPALLHKSTTFRAGLPELARGLLGQYLREVSEAVSNLEFHFPPSADELARLSGATRVPQKTRIAERLGVWCDTISQKNSRWRFATGFMRHVASEEGPIGKARAAIDAGDSKAVAICRKAIQLLRGTSAIEAHSEEYSASLGRTSVHLHARGVEYLDRQFAEALGHIEDWVKVVERERGGSQHGENQMRTTLGNLHSRLEKASRQLRQEADAQREIGEGLKAAVADWIARRCDDAISALEGADTESFASIDEALTAERDLLPSIVRQFAEEPAMRLAPMMELLNGPGVPQPLAAFDNAIREGAFETASRIATRFQMDSNETLAAAMAAYASVWIKEIQRRDRRLKMLFKVDYKHQGEIGRGLNWCEIARSRLRSISDGSEIDDLSDIPAYLDELDEIAEMIESNIRQDQATRIRSHRTEKNADEADAILVGLNTLTPEAVEDRIAQLRDGRSAANFDSDNESLVACFLPEFVSAAATESWPRRLSGYERAFATSGLLLTEEDRRRAALELVSLYREAAASISTPKPLGSTLKAFFEEIGFKNVHVSNQRRIARMNSWQMNLSAQIQSDGWFLPPIFGSKSNGNYALFLLGTDTLPETIQTALDPKVPTILFIAGTADLARRQEFAERLRASSIPAILIDEALVAFVATRRETRARTIFECGLPYGRVEPYTTDAGQIPPEMFFGRAAEIREIMSKTADGCLVYGGRQLGKSALLNHVSRIYHAPQEDRIVVRREVKPLGNSEPAKTIWQHLNSMLSQFGAVRENSRDSENVSRDIRAWLMTRPSGQIVCLFDETDHFMAAETKADYPELSRLKELMEDTGRAFKVVFAGLHNVQRIYRQPNSPLAHLGRPICIGPLNRTQDDKRAAHDLVVAPMRAAGFRFESSEAVEEILAWANYYPSLVQEYAKGLLSTLHGAGSGKDYRLAAGGPLWTIHHADIFEHQGFGQIEARIREKFHLTLELDPRYALVAYTLAWLNTNGNEHQALVTGFRPAELLEQAMSFWPRTAEQPSQAAFEALLDEMFDLGVLGKVVVPGTQRFAYCLRTRQVAAMLGSTEDIEQSLLELGEKDPSISYDRSIHRRPYDPQAVTSNQRDWPYSPLTDLQIERLLSKEGGLRIVCGLDTLGLGKVGTALKRMSETAQLPGALRPDIVVTIANTIGELRNAVEKNKGNMSRLTVVIRMPDNSRDAETEIGWIERQSKVIDGDVRPIILLDASNEKMRGIATGRPETTEFLQAWGAEMLRIHLHNFDLTSFDTPAQRAAILSATGGIPTDTIKLVNQMEFSDDPDAVVRKWTPSSRFADRLTSGTLGRALSAIEEVTNPGDYDAINDLIRDMTGADIVSIGPDLLATGLIAGWNHKARSIRRSALGELVARAPRS